VGRRASFRNPIDSGGSQRLDDTDHARIFVRIELAGGLLVLGGVIIVTRGPAIATAFRRPAPRSEQRL
jgi:hypothetical protein